MEIGTGLNSVKLLHCFSHLCTNICTVVVAVDGNLMLCISHYFFGLPSAIAYNAVNVCFEITVITHRSLDK